jgi:hypothetical protein
MTELRLVDVPDEAGRTTITLLASLASRLALLHVVSGSAAVGSLVSGFAALGREAARTIEGARLREAVASGDVGRNGRALWTTLGIATWATDLPPAPVLDHLRNDLALVLAQDLGAALERLPIPAEPAHNPPDGSEPAPATFEDCVVGLWAYSREMVRAVEWLAEAGGAGGPARETAPRPPRPEGSLLR